MLESLRKDIEKLISLYEAEKAERIRLQTLLAESEAEKNPAGNRSVIWNNRLTICSFRKPSEPPVTGPRRRRKLISLSRR